MERNIKPTYDELESYVENLQKQLADAQATIAALQARLDERLEFIKDCDIALDRIQAPHTNEGQEELVSTWRRIELVGSLLSQYRSTLEQMSTQLTQRTAELERVRLLSSHNERRFEMLEEKYKELCTLSAHIAALPKVEGEIAVKHTEVDLSGVWGITLNGYFTFQSALFDSKEEADAYAALLTRRQGME